MQTISIDEIGDLDSEGKIVVVDSQQWNNKPFPLIDFLQPAAFAGSPDVLAKGRWKVVSYHHDCPKCEHLIANAHQSVGTSLAFIEVPPLTVLPKTNSTKFFWFHLTDELKWFVNTPLIVGIEDGVVTNTFDD